MHQNDGDLAIDQLTRIPTVAAHTRAGWVTLSDQAASQPSPIADPNRLSILGAGTAASLEDLTAAADGTVVTTATSNVFQKQHNQWWRLTPTWTGECSAIPVTDIASASPRIRHAAPAGIRA